jgi:hypothetical protein
MVLPLPFITTIAPAAPSSRPCSALALAKPLALPPVLAFDAPATDRIGNTAGISTNRAPHHQHSPITQCCLQTLSKSQSSPAPITLKKQSAAPSDCSVY